MTSSTKTESPGRAVLSAFLIAFLDFLVRHADPDGVVRIDAEELGLIHGVANGRELTKTEVSDYFGALFHAGMITAEEGTNYAVITGAETAVEPPTEPPKVEVPATPQKAMQAITAPSNGRSKKSAVPICGVATREPRDQNEHTMALVNCHQIGGSAMHVAMVANVEIGLAAYKAGKPFHRTERELTPEYIADKCGLSVNAARTAMANATKLGFLVRTDNGKGGRGKTNRAKYRPSLPRVPLTLQILEGWRHPCT